VPRTLLGLAALAALVPSSRAEQAVTTSETVIRLTVQPMAAPKPALRFLLLPELKEINPGNPIQNYLKCFSEQQNFFFNKESCERREALLVMPLSALPARELQDYGRSALRQADWAARLDKADWQILLKLKTDGIGLLLPDVQGMRTLASALKVRFRGEVALHHYDDAIRTAKTMFALSRHMGEHPTLIGDLVGIAIAAVAIGPLEEMLEQPGCPNLYWALTNLPSPFIALDRGMEGERVVIAAEFPDLSDTNLMTEEQIQKLIARADKIRELEKIEAKPAKPDKWSTRAWLDARKDEASLRAARARLVETGVPEARLLRFPADQVLLLDERREYEERRDDIMKLTNLPLPQAEEAIPGLAPLNQDDHLFVLFVPAMHKVRRAQARLDQRIALLRCVEALRMYAAAHDGRLPEKLSDCPVPVPDDPFTGKPFLYKREGATAHLRGSPPRAANPSWKIQSEEKTPVYNVHYEITLQK
jgi:hypothetical protein